MSAAPEQEVEVERLKHELAQLRAEFQDFTYSVSHDLRAPLRHIRAFAQVIEEDLPDAPPDIRAHLSTIQQSAQLLTQQLDGLLMLSRLGQQAVKLQPVPVLPLLQSVLDELQQQQPQRQVQWHMAPDFPALWADADLLRQVFSHVLDNAMKFTRKRELAQIDITWQWAVPVDAETAAEPHATAFMPTLAQGQKLCQISITDNGIGFVPEQASKLFKVFAKLHLARDFEGLGLGLVASRKLLAHMGGSIGISAQVNGGCQVQISLPSRQ